MSLKPRLSHNPIYGSECLFHLGDIKMATKETIGIDDSFPDYQFIQFMIGDYKVGQNYGDSYWVLHMKKGKYVTMDELEKQAPKTAERIKEKWAELWKPQFEARRKVVLSLIKSVRETITYAKDITQELDLEGVDVTIHCESDETYIDDPRNIRLDVKREHDGHEFKEYVTVFFDDGAQNRWVGVDTRNRNRRYKTLKKALIKMTENVKETLEADIRRYDEREFERAEYKRAEKARAAAFEREGISSPTMGRHMEEMGDITMTASVFHDEGDDGVYAHDARLYKEDGSDFTIAELKKIAALLKAE